MGLLFPSSLLVVCWWTGGRLAGSSPGSASGPDTPDGKRTCLGLRREVVRVGEAVSVEVLDLDTAVGGPSELTSSAVQSRAVFELDWGLIVRSPSSLSFDKLEWPF
jgi:hypothetical protein